MNLAGRAFVFSGPPERFGSLPPRGPRHTLVLGHAEAAFELPWCLLRQLLGELHALRGPQPTARALAPHHGPLSLVLRGLPLDPDATAARDRLAASAEGYLSHNGLMRWPLVTAWREALAPLCAGVDILVPDLAAADPHSVVALLALLYTQPDLRLALGLHPEGLSDDPVLRWDQRNAQAQGERLARLPGVTPLEPGEGCALPTTLRLHPADDDCERRAHAPRTTPADRLDAMERAFAAYGFTACERLGLQELARGAPEGAMGRRLHLLTGLSAYNRQVGTRGESPEADEALAALLQRCFEGALDGEPHPAVRSHLLYRLCINAGRRKSELPLAMSLAQRAVEEGRGHPMAEAWALNGVAYVLGRQRQTDEAIAACERAAALLQDPLPYPAEAERALSRVVLVDNMVELCLLAGRWEDAARRQRAYEVDALPEMVPSGRALRALRTALRPAELRALAERGLRIAERLFDFLEADYMTIHAADGAYRQGDAAAAAALFAVAVTGAEHLATAVEVEATELSRAMALLRAGAADEAVAALGRLAEGRDDPEREGALGWAMATAGDVAGSEAAINGAIQRAVASGKRDVLARVACYAGEACLALGRLPEARQAFEQGLAIARVGEGSAPADLLWALAGCIATGGADAARLDEAVALLPAALAEAEAWWELRRLEAALPPAERPPLLLDMLARRDGVLQ